MAVKVGKMALRLMKKLVSMSSLKQDYNLDSLIA